MRLASTATESFTLPPETMPRMRWLKAARDNNIDHSHRVKRRFLAFCTLAVVPCGIASGAAARAADDAWEELAHASATRIARLALGTLEQDLGAALDSLLGSADPLPSPDTTIEAVRLAMAGDTVSALDPTASGVELMVLFPDAEGLLRFANGMLAPGAAVLVGRVARARVGLYVNGELWSATDPPPSVEVIDRETLLGGIANTWRRKERGRKRRCHGPA